MHTQAKGREAWRGGCASEALPGELRVRCGKVDVMRAWRVSCRLEKDVKRVGRCACADEV